VAFEIVWRAILIQPSARLRPLSLALHPKASYASRAEAVTPVRRRTARTAGGQSSHSHPPGCDRSRSRPAPMPLTHSMRRTLFPSLPSSPPIPGSPPFPRDVASTLLFRHFLSAAFVDAGCTFTAASVDTGCTHYGCLRRCGLHFTAASVEAGRLASKPKRGSAPGSRG